MIIQLKTDDMRGTKPPIEPQFGVFICGGAIRRWFNGSEELSDIDIFSPNKQQQENFLKSLDEAKIEIQRRKEWNESCKNHGKILYQE